MGYLSKFDPAYMKEVHQYHRSQQPKTMKQRVTFQYRDASNFKFQFSGVVETSTPFTVSDDAGEIPYERLGYDQARFHKEVVKYPYNDQDDHNLLEVLEVENVPDDTEVDYKYDPEA